MAQAWHRHDSAAVTSRHAVPPIYPIASHRPAAAYNMLAGQEGDASRVAQTMTAARRARRSGIKAAFVVVGGNIERENTNDSMTPLSLAAKRLIELRMSGLSI
jgi:hypothetical protein